MQIVDRDMEMFKLASYFGCKVFDKSLLQTVFNSTTYRSMNERLKLLIKNRYLKAKKTNRTDIGNCYFLTSKSKKILEEIGGYNIRLTNMPEETFNHLICEQVSLYYIKKMDKDIKRTVVVKSSKRLSHTPDFIYKEQDLTVYLEIEMNAKSKKRYFDIFRKVKNDGANAVIYVFLDNEEMQKIASKIPIFSKDKDKNLLYFTHLENLKSNYKNSKMGAISQLDFIKNRSCRKNKT